MLETQIIKDALKEVGLNEGLHSFINVEDEEALKEAIIKMKEATSIKEGASNEEILKQAELFGLKDSFEKIHQSETDKRVTEGIKTREENLRKEILEELNKDKDKDKSKNKEGENDMPKEFLDALKLITDRLEKIEPIANNYSNNLLETQIKASLKVAGLDDSFLEFIKVKEESEIETAVKSLKEKTDKALQVKLDKQLEEGIIPETSFSKGNVEEGTIKSYAQKKNKPESVGDFKGIAPPTNEIKK